MHHRLFRVPELSLEILESLDQVDVYHLGMTCTSLWTLAVPVLWKKVSEADALSYLVPNDIRVEGFERTEGRRDRVMLSRELEETEWQSLVSYTRHICDLSILDAPDPRTIDLKWHALFALYTYKGVAGSLFPKLSLLSLHIGSRRSAMASTSLVPTLPALRHLKVRISDRTSRETNSYENLLRAIANGRVSGQGELSSLRVAVPERYQSWGSLSQRDDTIFGPNLTGLQELHLGIIVEEVSILPALASLAQLAVLSLQLERNAPLLKPYALPSQSFPSLRKIFLTSKYSSHQPNYTDLLHSIASPSLESLYLDFSTLELRPVRSILEIVGQKWAQSLRAFRGAFGTFLEEPTDVTPFDAIHPLTACHVLKRFRMSCFHLEDFFDVHYEMMANAWPDLELLDLICSPSKGSHYWTPRASRRTLSLLSKGMPQLSFLRTALNFDLEAVKTECEGSTSLRVLNLCFSLSSKPAETA